MRAAQTGRSDHARGRHFNSVRSALKKHSTQHGARKRKVEMPQMPENHIFYELSDDVLRFGSVQLCSISGRVVVADFELAMRHQK